MFSISKGVHYLEIFLSSSTEGSCSLKQDSFIGHLNISYSFNSWAFYSIDS